MHLSISLSLNYPFASILILLIDSVITCTYCFTSLLMVVNIALKGRVYEEHAHGRDIQTQHFIQQQS